MTMIETVPVCSCGRDDRAGDHRWQPGCDDPFPLDGDVTLPTMLEIPGLTYRRLDYWTRSGLLEPDNATPGSGNARVWTGRDYDIVCAMVALMDIGLELRVAHKAAVAWVDDGINTITIGPATITWRLTPRH